MFASLVCWAERGELPQTPGCCLDCPAGIQLCASNIET